MQTRPYRERMRVPSPFPIRALGAGTLRLWTKAALLLVLLLPAAALPDRDPRRAEVPAAGTGGNEVPSTGGSAPDTQVVQASALRVLLVSPEGNRDALLSIDAGFTEPMVPLGKRGENSRRGPIRFEPELKGSFTWIGTSAVSFLLESPPPAGTRITCTIPGDTRSSWAFRPWCSGRVRSPPPMAYRKTCPSRRSGRPPWPSSTL